jgi:DNA-binding LacI/PurR family transcriptional regulator
LTTRRTRLQDIARAAGVSPATVSRVVNRTGRVSADVEARVQAAADRLRVDLRGRRRPGLIAFLLGNRPLLHPFHSRILAGAEACCAPLDYHVVFLPVQYPPQASWQDLQVPHLLKRRDFVDGFIFAGAHSQNLLDLVERTGLPMAVQGNNVMRPWRSTAYDTVDYDDVDGSYQMTRHMQTLGHRHIWFVGNRRYAWFDRCYEGYARAMLDAGLEPLDQAPDTELPRDVGYLGAKSILASGAPVTAIFAASDLTAKGVCDALRDSGRLVPDVVSVAGLDDIEAQAMYPRLATVHVYLEQIGRQLAEMVLSRMNAPGLAPRYVNVPTSLVKGESVRAVDTGRHAVVTALQKFRADPA